jgi:hypothetical protein
MRLRLILAAVFFICFRECLETSIIVSVLLAFLKQTLGPDRDPLVYKKLLKQVSNVTFQGHMAESLAMCIKNKSSTVSTLIKAYGGFDTRNRENLLVIDKDLYHDYLLLEILE